MKNQLLLPVFEEETVRPKRLLTDSNKWLRRDKIWSWTIPALAVQLPQGGTFKTCPSAGICAQVCYARNGSYNFRNVKAAHLNNLLYVLEDPEGWKRAMLAELSHKRFIGAYVRIHDAGDFFSGRYTDDWLEIIRATPRTTFYAYTKEVEIYEERIAPNPPENSAWILSLGGTQDHKVDPDRHRIAEVFPTEEAIGEAGYHSQTTSDLLAAFGPTPVGMTANNIPQFKKRQGDRTFGQWQAEQGHRPRGTTDR